MGSFRLLANALRRTWLKPRVERFEALQELTRLYSEPNAPRVLVLGDSVMERVSKDDIDRRTLGNMIIEELVGTATAAAISYSGYHLGVFAELVRALKRLPFHPQLIVVPINLRSFSPQWDLNPKWRYDEDIAALKRYANGDELSTCITLERKNIEATEFHSIRVDYPGSRFKTIGDYLNVVRSKPSNPDDEAARRRDIFHFHYLYEIGVDHHKLEELVRLVDDAEELGVSIMFYTVPVNYQAGVELLGEMFDQHLAKQVQTVRSRTASSTKPDSRVVFRDLSTAITRDMFFHSYEPTEHLNERGRTMTARLVASACATAFATPALAHDA